MPRLKREDLKKIKESAEKQMALREGETTVKVTVHMGTCGIAAGAKEVMDALNDEIKDSARRDIRVVASGCMGMCSSEPNVTVEMLGKEGIIYEHMDGNKMRQVFRRHILLGEVQTGFAQARMR